MPPVYPSGDIDREAAARQRGGCGALREAPRALVIAVAPDTARPTMRGSSLDAT